MRRTQIYLTDEERRALKAIARRLGKTQSELIRNAVDRYIERYQSKQRTELMSQARGMWADRDDLPDFDAIRRELDRVSQG